MAEGCLHLQPLTNRRPSAQRRHVGLGPGFIDEDKAARVDATLMGSPLLSPAGNVRAILLDSDQRLFL
jgi:hypothetical protein